MTPLPPLSNRQRCGISGQGQEIREWQVPNGVYGKPQAASVARPQQWRPALLAKEKLCQTKAGALERSNGVVFPVAGQKRAPHDARKNYAAEETRPDIDRDNKAEKGNSFRSNESLAQGQQALQQGATN
ncbi:hypothetical protein HPB50_015317 [Hyalomma asiaticum]|uniref:Uncharacterized protein n=1 Tax=Hyalomma asiaticum TaxID=266040 RepID=A0ACB7TIL2_HYAAI|nr:hypothetical protein HPB50_015317 [Hyalomma asiaticum]